MSGPSTAQERTALPPGQQLAEGFPRFGTHLHRPPPVVLADAAIEIRGAVRETFSLPVRDLASLPRRQMTSDFHCVSGWSAVNLAWEGVPFATFFSTVIEPSLQPDARITHLVFGGLDGFQSMVLIEDALDADVLIADRLGGQPLSPDDGAPARLVSPKQYGYMSTKHLCSIEVHTTKPTAELGAATSFSRVVLRGPLIKRHPRARVAEEERHPNLPARWLRPIYRLAIRPGILMGSRSSRGGDQA